jgi:hypothetical protein
MHFMRKAQQTPGKRMFDVKVQNVSVGQKFHADCVAKGGMPGDTLVVKVYRGFTVVADRAPPGRYCKPCRLALQGSLQSLRKAVSSTWK